MQLTEKETAIREEAIKFARKHKKRIAKRITNQSLFPPESDPDDLRHEFTAYEGNNSWLFQPAVSILVEKIHVNRLKSHFGGDIRVDLLLKNNEGGNRVYKANIERIDNYVAEKYTRADLEKMLLPR